MSKELVISANRHETKVAILEDDQLVEIYFQRANEYSLAGSIHKGRVTRVLPGMQSAFVDLGLERDTFLYVSDFFEENEEYEPIPAGREERERRPERERERAPQIIEARVEAPTEEAVAAVEPDSADSAPRSETPPAAGSPPAAEGDDRGRGRRSRRRRGRGRGFPESKYAPEARYGREAAPAPVSVTPPAESAAEEAAPVATASSQDFSILPGESLAKYSRSVDPLDEHEVEEIRSAQGSAEPTEPEEAPEAEPETEAEHPATVASPVSAPPEFNEMPPPLPMDLQASEREEVPDPADEAAALAIADEETNAEVEAEAAAEAAVGEDAGVPAESTGGPGAEGATSPLSANVREQGGRYMHRLTRRMRRKMRSGQGEDRRTEPALGPVAPAVVEAPAKPDNGRPAPRQDKPSLTPSITELLKEGQEIIVQIAKEPLGQKGARITSHIALPGRYVVYMPTLEHMGVSRKVGSDEERLRLKRILNTHRAGVPGGYIVRTAGEGKSEDEIAADMSFLFNLWLDIRQKAERRPAPALLHHDLDIVQRTLRDQLTENFKAIWVDNEEVYESILRFVERFQPSLVSRVKLYTRPAPIFDSFNITTELEKALRPKVWLKSGGYIVINQTEALVAIDVNTGKYVGKSNRLEDTIVKTNTEAVKEIVRQVRLRDLGGIIVVDFIDMDERKNRQKVMQALEDAMRSDRAPYKILQFNDFGLVAITRKRVKQSLERALCMPCPHCEGSGSVKSVQTIIGEILQEAHKIARAVEDEKDCILRVHPDVAKALKSNQNRYLEEMEEVLRRPVLVKSDPALHHEKFDLA